MPVNQTNIPKQSLDALFLGGGTLINRDPLYLSIFRNTPASSVFVFGTGVCSPEFWQRRPGWIDHMRDWVTCLRLSEFIGVRGPYSKQRLIKAGIRNRQIQIIGDPALSLARSGVWAKRLRKHIGINIGTAYGNLWGTDIEVCGFIITACFELIKRGWDITFVPVWPADVPCIERAAKMISSPSVSIFRQFDSIKATMDILESMDVFIGQKLHSVVLAMCVYTPSIMLEYRPKCLDFMASMGLEAFNMRTDALSVDRLLQLVGELYNNTLFYQRALRRGVVHYAQEQRKYANEITRRLYNY